MKPEILRQKVDLIIAGSGDFEAAHANEDKIHLEIINEFCPDWVINEIKRLSDADFARYCA